MVLFLLPLKALIHIKVYEQSSSTNLDPLLALNEIDNSEIISCRY